MNVAGGCTAPGSASDEPSPCDAANVWASPEARRARLTAREWEVLAVLVTGASNRQISERLYISPRTVTNHLVSIYAKLGARRRAEAVACALGTRAPAKSNSKAIEHPPTN
jgi:DNA-binding NarL/FixJ family response regulator